jgi:hypothetical protein
MERARSGVAGSGDDAATLLPPPAPTTALPPPTASERTENELEGRLSNLDRTTIVTTKTSAERTSNTAPAPSVVAKPTISAARVEAEKSNPLLVS